MDKHKNMRKLVVSLCTLFTLTASAQDADPVLLTVNGKPITRSEFEYSFNKNSNVEGAVEKKSVEEYIDMFINYKLKVAAAEAAQLDTLSSFQREFKQYRDLQLTPYLVDQLYIDSVARSIYQRTADQLKGKDMLCVAHILVMVKPNASDAERDLARAKADSLRQQILGGDDFAELAKKYSQDPGSAFKGGELPWIGPGMTLREFEGAAYDLKAGEISGLVPSAVGYHIIKMLERKQLEPYEQLKPTIMKSLQQQGIEEASALHRIKQLMAASGGRMTRDEVMDSVLQAHLSNPELKYLVQEYHDGLLLYEISKQQVWDVAASDKDGLEKWFKSHKKQYRWDEPRFKGFVYYSKLPKQEKAISAALKKHGNGDWRKVIKDEFNHDSLTVRVTGPYLCKQGENAVIDHYVFDSGKPVENAKFPYAGVVGKKMKQPKSYLDVKSLVINDYQKMLEDQWVESLRQKFSFKVDESVLKTVNNH